MKSEIEARLIAKAAAQGLSVEAYLASLIEGSLTKHEEQFVYQVSIQEEWEAILTDLINSPAFSLVPALSDAAISRESIYTREDEIDQETKIAIHAKI